MFVKEFLLINLDTTLVVDTKLNISGYFLPNPSPPPKKRKDLKKANTFDKQLQINKQGVRE